MARKSLIVKAKRKPISIAVIETAIVIRVA